MTQKTNEKMISYHQAINNGSLESTWSFEKFNDVKVPFQNGLPYPSFEPQEREKVDLSGIWKKQRFNADHNWTMLQRNEAWVKQTELESNGIPFADFQDHEWEEKQIPAPENILTGKEEVGAAETYENGVWYRRFFTLSEDQVNKVLTLKSLGISYVADIWVNGVYIGYHEGGYTPFAFDLSKVVKEGENLIAVRIDNPPWTTRFDTVPAVDNDFFNYTGIIQDLYIELVESVQVVRADVVPKGIDGVLAISVLLENRTNEAQKVSLKPEIWETDHTSIAWLTEPDAKNICSKQIEVDGFAINEITLEPHETKVFSYMVQVKQPKLWSVRKPHLYVLGLEIFGSNRKRIDQFYTQFGIRMITTEGTQICLNDSPLFLAGVARHEEWPEYGRTATWDRIVADLVQIEGTKVNMVRTAHYPNHIYTFIVLDRLGLTSMAEIPLWQFEKEHYEVQERRQLSYQMWREMIFSSYNRPSIIMWSTQNESKEVKLRKQYNENLVAELREFYHEHRLVTQSAAADQPGYYDESMEPLDVCGWTMYFGIFHGSTPYEGTRDFIEKAHQHWPNKPILNTEYGLWSNADGSFIDKQYDVYRDVHLALIEKATVTPQGALNDKGYVAGIDYWTIFDWYVNHNQFYQTMGIYKMDRQGTKKVTDAFLADHHRLMAISNGMAIEGESIKSKKLPFEEVLIEKSLELELPASVDFTRYNYLRLTVTDSVCKQKLHISFESKDGQEESYETYLISDQKYHHLYIPIWILKYDVLSDSQKIVVKAEAALKLSEIVCIDAAQ